MGRMLGLGARVWGTQGSGDLLPWAYDRTWQSWDTAGLGGLIQSKAGVWAAFQQDLGRWAQPVGGRARIQSLKV